MGFPRICRCPRKAGRPSRRLLLPRSFWAVQAPQPHTSRVPSPPRQRRSPPVAPSGPPGPKHLGGSRGPGAAPQPRPPALLPLPSQPLPHPRPDFPNRGAPRRARSLHPRRARGHPGPSGGAPREEAKVSPRRPGSPGAGRLLLAQASPPSPAGLRSASRGAAQAQETLRTCPGSQDSGGAGEGSQGTGFWRPATIEGGPQAPSPCSGPRRGGWSDSIPCPSSPASARRSTRTYTPVGRPLRRRLPLLCSLPLPSSCWPETHFASARHPRPAANSPPERTLRRGRRRPRHLRLDARGRHVRLPLAPRCLPAALSRGGGDRGGQCPRLFEVPLVKKKKISNTVHASDLL